MGDSAFLAEDDLTPKEELDAGGIGRELADIEDILGRLEWVGACEDDVEVFRLRVPLEFAEEGMGVKIVPLDGGGRGKDPDEECPENCDEPGALVDIATS
jgi:hypothetical protein